MNTAVESQRDFMDVEFADADLNDLETNPCAVSAWAQAIVRSFRRKMRIIRDAFDERDLRALKSLHFEKLNRPRREAEVYSIRLNDQWRLTFNILKTEPKHTIRIIAIEDYH
ncbi:type II toxin-antitoxin system RelE/ParE family toxin [Schlesneria sp.]|uniref:type II toxin-antitoxin system RelE/ParE family toxin n=1 Tax=Schlesneria sp. TaxID=2762018 RepID=UPI003F813CE6